MEDNDNIEQSVVIVKDRASIGPGSVSFAENYVVMLKQQPDMMKIFEELDPDTLAMFLTTVKMSVAFLAADIMIGRVKILAEPQPGFTSGENDNSERGHNEQS